MTGTRRRQAMRSAFVVLLVGASSVGFACQPGWLDLSTFCNGNDEVDDTECIRQWIEAGHNQEKQLYAPAGKYLYNDDMPLYRNMVLKCAGPDQTIFTNNGGSALFFQAPEPVHGVRIEQCGFDVKGSTVDYLTVIAVNPDPTGRSSKILVRRNRFFDSAILGTMSAQQRQYILLLNCMDCRVEDNHLTEGGRIKLGRPGQGLSVTGNRVEKANDNAITVVDIGSGSSKDITIEDNHVIDPKGVGIFFGADGEGQTSPSLTTKNVRIVNNTVRGDWLSACILGTLPAIAEEITVDRNTCVKTGTSGTFQIGIGISRTNEPTERAKAVRVTRNKVSSTVIGGGEPAPLDYGGVFFKGKYKKVRVTKNEIRNVGPRAMLFRTVDILDGRVVENTLVGGTIFVEGTIQGEVQP